MDADQGSRSDAVGQPAPPSAASITAQLIDLSRQFESFDAIVFEADIARGLAEGDRYLIVSRVADLAEIHARRVGAECFQSAIELPATTILDLGLQARLIARELDEWWGDEKLQPGERACRQLLTRLIALAGLERIHVPDVTAEELFGWLKEPEQKARNLLPATLLKSPADGARS